MTKPANKQNVENNNGVVANHIDQVTINSEKKAIKPSILAKIIKHIIQKNIFSGSVSNPISYDVTEKIAHNNIIKYRQLIEEYYSYAYICESTLNTIDDVSYGNKSTVLRHIHDLYILTKGEFTSKCSGTDLSVMQIVQLNSDRILDKIIFNLENDLSNSLELAETATEDLLVNLRVFIVYCFVECHILEKP